MKSDIDILRSSRIYFGHQSVGRNILDGLAGLTEGAIAVAPLDSARGSSQFFVESQIGRNGEPATKCAHFRKDIEKLSGTVEIALMKFCYIDFDNDTQVESVFRTYKATIQALRSEFPQMTLVHTTAPLKSSGSPLKGLIKRVLGRPDLGGQANLKRCRFNELLRQQYRNEPIFDLAAVESTNPRGGRSSFVLDGQTGYSLASEYTDDGGHLNPLGSQLAAPRASANACRRSSFAQVRLSWGSGATSAFDGSSTTVPTAKVRLAQSWPAQGWATAFHRSRRSRPPRH